MKYNKTLHKVFAPILYGTQNVATLPSTFILTRVVIKVFFEARIAKGRICYLEFQTETTSKGRFVGTQNVKRIVSYSKNKAIDFGNKTHQRVTTGKRLPMGMGKMLGGNRYVPIITRTFRNRIEKKELGVYGKNNLKSKSYSTYFQKHSIRMLFHFRCYATLLCH